MFSESNSRWLAPLLLASSAAVMVLLVWLLLTGRAGGWLAHVGVALILGGAAGNAADRIIHGAVTDFVEVRLGTYRWPAFNVADSAISIGAALVLIELLFGARKFQSDSVGTSDAAEYPNVPSVLRFQVEHRSARSICMFHALSLTVATKS